MPIPRTRRIQVCPLPNLRSSLFPSRIKGSCSSVVSSVLLQPTVQLLVISSSLGMWGSMAALVQPEPVRGSPSCNSLVQLRTRRMKILRIKSPKCLTPICKLKLWLWWETERIDLSQINLPKNGFTSLNTVVFYWFCDVALWKSWLLVSLYYY